MNPVIDSIIPPSAQPGSVIELPPAPLQPAAVPPRRLKGKIPSLPKAHRDTINRLLSDGATYACNVARYSVDLV